MAEFGRSADTGEVVAQIDPQHFRPAEVDSLLSVPGMPHASLGWPPTITTTTKLDQQVAEVVVHHREEAATQRRDGFAVVGSRK